MMAYTAIFAERKGKEMSEDDVDQIESTGCSMD